MKTLASRSMTWNSNGNKQEQKASLALASQHTSSMVAKSVDMETRLMPLRDEETTTRSGSITLDLHKKTMMVMDVAVCRGNSPPKVQARLPGTGQRTGQTKISARLSIGRLATRSMPKTIISDASVTPGGVLTLKLPAKRETQSSHSSQQSQSCQSRACQPRKMQTTATP